MLNALSQSLRLKAGLNIPEVHVGKSAEQRKKARQKLGVDYIRPWAKNIDQQIVGRFVAGDDLSVADLKIYMVLVWFKKGALDHIPTDFFDGFSKLTSLFEAVTAHPKVVQWYQ